MTALATLPGFDVGRYFIAPDADGEPTLWRGAVDDLAPVAALTCHELRNVPDLWDTLVALVATQCPACDGVGAIQHGSRNPELDQDCPRCDGDGLVDS